MNTATPEAHQLFLEGAVALADVERNGIRTDVPYLKKAIGGMDAQIKEIEEKLQSSKLYAAWQRRHGRRSNLGSYTQLADLVYGELGYECTEWTSGGKTGKRRPKVDKGVLERIDHPFVRRWLRMQKLSKAKGTAVGLLREVVDGLIHPNFNLNFVISYRSGCREPNIQNQPNRDPEIAEIIRRAIVARNDDYVFLEVDLSQAEVRASCAYHHDPVLVRYMEGGGDIHFDVGMELFLLTKEQMTGFKGARQNAKNQFVFPEFYGSYYVQTAAGTWDYIDRNKLALMDGTPLRDHLKAKGIGTLEKYTAHVQKVEDAFWNKRFRVYTDWKKRWYAEYQKAGGFRFLTGFWVEGILSRNEVINLPVQGVAFHWLLWSLIQLNRWLRRHKMRSMIVGEVHDSLLIDCHKDELQDVLVKAKQIMTVALRKHWEWINVPVVVEAEASQPGGSWFEKRHVEI